jgi:hypothetical protein
MGGLHTALQICAEEDNDLSPPLSVTYSRALNWSAINAQIQQMSRGILAAIVSLTLVAGWLRLESTSFGLPDQDVGHLFRPDEDLLIPRALQFGPDWNPHTAFPYPAAQMYLQSAGLRIYAGCLGHWHDYRSVYAPHSNAEAYIVGRRITALMGTATVPVIYFAAAPAFGEAVALISAAAVAFAPSHVRDSKFATADVPAGFWTALAILMLLRIVQRGSWSDYLLAGVFCGVAFATKYPAGALLFGVFTAHLESRRRDPLLRSLVDRKVFLIVIGFGTAVIVCSPYLVFDWSQAIQDFRIQWAQTVAASTPQTGNGWSWLLLRAMPDCFGPAFEGLVIGGIIWGLVRPQPGTTSLAVFIVAELLAISTDGRPFYRYLLVPLPAMAILGTVFGCQLTSRLCTALGRTTGSALVFSLSILLLGLTLLSFLIRDVEFNKLLLREDTRTLAREWIEANVPPGSRIAVTSEDQFGKPQLSIGNYNWVPMEDLASLQQKHIYWVLSDGLDQLPAYSPGLSELEQDQLSRHATLVYDMDPLRHNSTTFPIFDEGDAFYAPFGGICAMERPGPRIRIWRLK